MNNPSVIERGQQMAEHSQVSSLPVSQAQTETQALLQMIERVLVDPKVDIEKLRAVMDMRKEAFHIQNELEFNKAMALVQAELRAVGRTKTNTQTKSRYATIDNILEQATAWTSQGISIMFGTEEASKAGHYKIVADLRHSGGYVKRYSAEVPSDHAGIAGSVNKTGIHAFGSSMTYGRRYLLCLIFNIAMADDDDGQAAGQGQHQRPQQQRQQSQAQQRRETLVSPAQIKQLQDAIKVTGKSVQAFCQKAGIASIDQLAQARFIGSMRFLQSQAQGAE